MQENVQLPDRTHFHSKWKKNHKLTTFTVSSGYLPVCSSDTKTGVISTYVLFGVAVIDNASIGGNQYRSMKN